MKTKFLDMCMIGVTIVTFVMSILLLAEIIFTLMNNLNITLSLLFISKIIILVIGFGLMCIGNKL